MPKIGRQVMFDLFYSSATHVFSNQQILKNSWIRIGIGRPLYRYVDYRNSKPQEEWVGRKFWRGLAGDDDNRWSGSRIENTLEMGHSGLYFSEEQPGPLNTGFPETAHYTGKLAADSPRQELDVISHAPGRAPAFVKVDAHNAKSFFLYMLEQQIKGLDLTIYSPLAKMIFDEAVRREPGFFIERPHFETHYNDPEDAAFNRGAGLAAFDLKKCEFIRVTSVRDNRETNVIVRGGEGTVTEVVKGMGQATAYLQGDEFRIGYTKENLLYNDTLLDPKLKSKL